jgi:hypothetical protein
VDIRRSARHFDADCKHTPRNYRSIDQVYALEPQQQINSRIEHCANEAPPPAMKVGHSAAVVGEKIGHIRGIFLLLKLHNKCTADLCAR